MSARPKLRIDESLTNADWTKRTDDHLDGGPSLKKQIGAELETTTVTFEVIEFSVACDEHDEFACHSAACRPPTSGGTGGSSPGPSGGSEAGGTPGSPGAQKGAPMWDLLTKNTGYPSLDDYDSRVDAKQRSVAAVSSRMLKDSEFQSWLKEALETTMPNDPQSGKGGPKTSIAMDMIEQAGLQDVTGATMRDAAEMIIKLDELPVKSVEEYVAQRVCDSLIEAWANTSSNGSVWAHAGQMAAAEIHGVNYESLRKHPAASPNTIATAEKRMESDGGLFRSFARAEYAATQKYLAENGITSITLYRGVVFDADGPMGSAKKKDIVDIESNPLSSWSGDRAVAYRFSRGGGAATARYKNPRMIVFSMVVPASMIQSLPLTGRGCLPEAEAVVIGRPSSAAVAESSK